MCGSPSRSRDVMFRETTTTKWCLLALFVVSCFARGPPAPPPLASSVLAGDQNDVQDYLRPRIVAVASEGEEEETAHSEGPYEGDLPFVTLLGETARGVIPGPLWALRTDEGAEGERRGEIPPPPPPLLKEPYAGTWRKPVLPLFGYYLPDQNLVSDPCKSDVQYFYTSLSNGDFWPYQMMDSWGKMPDGYIDGNMLVMGAFDECLYVKVSKESHSFEGQYCMILLSNITATNETEELGTEGKGLLRVASSLRPTQFFPMYSTCLPSTCNETDLQDSLKEVVHSQGLDVPAVFCQTSAPPSLAYNARDIVMIIVLVLLVLMAAMATVVDIFIAITNQQRIAKGPLRYLLVFSLYTNLPKMFRINTNQNKEVISCLLGMRVLSMTWVVWGHQYLISFFTTANKLSGMKKYLTGNLLNQIILNAMPSVDTFFFMSGLLVAYGLTKEFERTRKLNPVIFYIHRFLRLSVPIMLVAGFMAVFPPLLVRGPLAPFTTAPKNIADYCSRYWWRDAFFVSNFFTEGGNFEMCLAVCWYTSVDFQLFLVTPVVLLPLLHRPRPAKIRGSITLLKYT